MSGKNRPGKHTWNSVIKPPPVNLPAICSVVAPASAMEGHMIDAGLQKLREVRVNPEKSFTCSSNHRYLAGSDSERASLLIDAFENEDSQVIFCVRGGYGSSRILNLLDFERISRNPKVFVGYSDITFLHCALWSKCKLVTFHGPTVSQLRVLPDEDIGSLLDVLASNENPLYRFPCARVLRGGKAEGRVFGGNLTCLCHVLGTSYEPELAGAILLLEDRGEALYRLDRMLNHLKLAGKLESLSGLLLGEFISCGPVSSIWELVLEVLGDIDIPVLAGIPVGHGSRNVTLPLGLRAMLDCDTKTLTYLERPTDAL